MLCGMVQIECGILYNVQDKSGFGKKQGKLAKFVCIISLVGRERDKAKISWLFQVSSILFRGP
jgi:hypothetical protein